MKVTIELENLEFYSFHGCYEVEHAVGNRFCVNAELSYDAAKAASTDDVADALDYQKAYAIISGEMSKESRLLETVCARILDSFFSTFSQLDYAKIKISKLNPPLGGKIGASSVTAERCNNSKHE